MLGNAQQSRTREQRSTQRVCVPTTDIDQWLEQLREEFQYHVGDRNNLTQRFAQFLEEHQRREERRTVLWNTNSITSKSEYAEGMTEVARSFIHIRQEFQGRGAMFDQLRRTMTTQLMPNTRLAF